MALNSQRTINDFRLGALLGAGSFGEVYEAFDTVSNAMRAIKIIKTTLNDDLIKLEHSKGDLLSSKLIDKNIVEYFGYFTANSSLYIIMRFYKNGSLDKLIKSHKQSQTQLDEKSVLKWSEDLIQSLNYMARQGIIHNDIKPG